MPKEFKFYDFAGILMPGAILIIGFILLYDPDNTLKGFTNLQLTIGDFGLFLILAYAIGHIVQAVGNWLENQWWQIRRGLPTTRCGLRNDGVISGEQRLRLLERARADFGLIVTDSGIPVNEKDWHILVRRMYSQVKNSERADRPDTFNGIYGLSRGLATAFTIVAVASFFIWGLQRWPISAFLSIFALLALYRMDRFGRHYARELFVQYLNLPEKTGGQVATKE